MKFIKTHGLKILLGIVAFYLLYLGYGVTKDMIFARVLAEAKAEYQQKVDALQAKADKAEAERIAIAEKAGREREELRLKGENDRRLHEVAMAAFKSRSAADLRQKNAKIEEVLTEKRKDEIALDIAGERIVTLERDISDIRIAWTTYDEQMTKAHRDEIDALNAKFTACQEWSAKLEAKIKPKPLAKLGRALLIGAAFMAGRIIK